MNYKQYTNHEISDLNKTKTWYKTPIKWYETPNKEKEKTDKKNEQVKYILHATGDADMDGRKYIALPHNCRTSDEAIRKKYNLF